MCIQLLMSNQTAHIIATSHLDTNVTVNTIVHTKQCVYFLLSIESVAILILIRHVRLGKILPEFTTLGLGKDLKLTF